MPGATLLFSRQQTLYWGCSEKKSNPYGVRKNCEYAVYILIFSIEKLGRTPPDLDKKKLSYFSNIDFSASIDELSAALDDILADIITLSAPPMENNITLPRQIDAFIEGHLWSH